MARNDFDGDGLSDILWQNWDGPLSSWLATPDGDFIVNPEFAFADIVGGVVALGDFNGDSRGDFLLVDQDHAMVMEATPDGGFLTHDPILYADNWSVRGSGDFNGDGLADLVWSQGGLQPNAFSIWQSAGEGEFDVSAFNAYTPLPNNVFIADVGDFDGNGRDDLLWFNHSTGELGYLSASVGGDFTVGNTTTLGFVAPNWQIMSTGDFDGDGRDDVLFVKHKIAPNGSALAEAISIWLGDDDARFAVDPANTYTPVSDGWSFGTIGDFNGDDREDIFWTHTSGATALWNASETGSFIPEPLGASVHDAWAVMPW